MSKIYEYKKKWLCKVCSKIVPESLAKVSPIPGGSKNKVPAKTPNRNHISHSRKFCEPSSIDTELGGSVALPEQALTTDSPTLNVPTTSTDLQIPASIEANADGLSPESINRSTRAYDKSSVLLHEQVKTTESCRNIQTTSTHIAEDQTLPNQSTPASPEALSNFVNTRVRGICQLSKTPFLAVEEDGFFTQQRNLTDILNISSNSLPSECNCVSNQELQQQLQLNETLSLNLESANTEIDSLSLENYELKRTLENYKRKVELYKSVGFEDMVNTASPLKFYTPQVTRRKRSRIQQGLPRTSTFEFSNGAMAHLMEKVSKRQVDANFNIPTYKEPSQKPANTIDVATIVECSCTVDKDKCPTAEKEFPRQHEEGITTPTISLNKDGSVQKSKVIIFGDEYGKGFNKLLKHQLGDTFSVTSIIKPGATTDKIIGDVNSLCKDFSKADYIIIIPSQYDRNPLRFQSFLFWCLDGLSHTNVFFCESFVSMFLNTSKVNDTIKLMCTQFKHANFVDFSFFARKPSKVIKSRILLREILKFNYKHNFYLQTPRATCSVGTQTRIVGDGNAKAEVHKETFFRDQH